MTLLRVRDVTIRFGGVVALDGVSLDLNRGEILGLIGPNGAGKTTLFNCISGVLQPDEGRIRYEKQSIMELRPHQRAQMGIARTFQNLQLFGTMTVLENCKLPIDALKHRNILSDALGLPFSTSAEKSADEHARAILHVLDLLKYQDELAADLPVGIQRRVEVARALAMRPRLLLLDEPAAGLDAEETLRLGDLLKKVRERFKVSMLLVDHDMSLVMRTCDYIYVLDFGRLLARGRPEEIRDDPRVIAAYLGTAEADVENPDPIGDTVIVAAGNDAVSETVASEELDDAKVEIEHRVTARDPELAAVEGRVEPEHSALLEVSGLAAGYGHLEVIRDVDLFVRPGELVACIGSNGAGKTTTLRAISGVIRPSRGTITFAGQDITGKRPEEIVGQGLLHVPQGRGLFPKLSVEDTLRLAVYSGHRGGDLTPAYDTFPKLKERRAQLVGTLSGGEQQMVAMARALLVRPKLLLVDEMSQGLAPAIVQQLFRHLEAFKEQGIAVFLVEQFVDSALAVADRAYIFEQGSVSHEAPADELRRDKKLIAGSYLGHGAHEAVATSAANGNGHSKELSADLMEEMMLKLPADLKRALEERAAGEGRKTQAVVLELLGKGRK